MLKINTIEKTFDISITSLFKITKFIGNQINKYSSIIIGLIVVFISISSWLHFYGKGQTLAYNDSRAHLDMARLVFDNLKPGVAQIGSVWLPLQHLLELITVWNDLMWRTGLSGSLVSMLSYVASTLYFYKFTKYTLKNTFISVLGTFVFALNINNVYMQTTPMSENLLMLFFICTSYYLYKWLKERKLYDFILMSGSVFLATLTRYDGWFLFLSVFLILGIIFTKESLRGETLKNKIKSFASKFGFIQGNLILYLTLAGFGIILWIFWNWAIFKDPLYFALGPYSAKSQQAVIESAGSLFTKNNLGLSLYTYIWAVIDNVGFLLSIYTLIGIVIYFIKNKLSSESIVIATLLTPFLFHVISLYFGNSFIVVPEVGTYLTEKANSYWFNLRYGLMFLPAVAFYSAYLASKDKFALFILSLLLVFESFVFIKFNNIVTLSDGVAGRSAFTAQDISDWLSTNANDDSLILMSMINNSVAFTTGFPLKRFIHEGTGRYWETSLANPSEYANWIVVKNTTEDPLHNALVIEHENEFLKDFDLVATFSTSDVYKRREHSRDFVYVNKNDLFVNETRYKFVGFNSYDLIYRTNEEIDETFRTAQEAGAKVIRFWVFGEGFEGSIQPEPGIYNQEKLKVIDFIFETARKYNIKLIPTLSNYWSDYGGIPQYVKWAGLPANSNSDIDIFYTNDRTISLYKSFVSTIVDRTNTISKIRYKDDPVVFGWDLMNEPRSSSGQKSLVVAGWISDMTSYVKSLDNDHIVLAGSEGSLLGSNLTAGSSPFFHELAGFDYTSVTTGHLYIYNPSSFNIDQLKDTISNWSWKSDLYQKPFILEEIGFSKSLAATNGIERDILYKNLFDFASVNDVDGILLWNWALKTDDNFGISPLDPGDNSLINIINDYSKQLNILE